MGSFFAASQSAEQVSLHIEIATRIDVRIQLLFLQTHELRQGLLHLMLKMDRHYYDKHAETPSKPPSTRNETDNNLSVGSRLFTGQGSPSGLTAPLGHTPCPLASAPYPPQIPLHDRPFRTGIQPFSRRIKPYPGNTPCPAFDACPVAIEIRRIYCRLGGDVGNGYNQVRVERLRVDYVEVGIFLTFSVGPSYTIQSQKE